MFFLNILPECEKSGHKRETCRESDVCFANLYSWILSKIGSSSQPRNVDCFFASRKLDAARDTIVAYSHIHSPYLAQMRVISAEKKKHITELNGMKERGHDSQGESCD